MNNPFKHCKVGISIVGNYRMLRKADENFTTFYIILIFNRNVTSIVNINTSVVLFETNSDRKIYANVHYYKFVYN